MQIDRIEEMRLGPEDEARIARLLARCFETDFGGRSYYQQRHHVRIVARKDRDIVGHLAICLRAVRLGETLVPIAGLADVATDPNHRGEGIATRLLEAAVEEVRSSPAHFFLLFGDENLYAAHSFRPMGNVLTHLDLDGARTGTIKTRTAKLMVLELGHDEWDATAPLDLLGHKF